MTLNNPSRKAFLFFGLIVFFVTALAVGRYTASCVQLSCAQKNTTPQTLLEQVINREEPTPVPSPTLLLPDMSIKVPTELYIAGKTSDKQLRFSTTFINLGPGALEVIGHADPENNVTHAAQYIFAKGGPGEYRTIGSFELHPTHKHWHVNEHVRYQLWSLEENGNKKEIVADTGKMSYCLWDEGANDLTIANAPQSRVYGFTCSRNTQGMSVGWSDTYAARVDGQDLDITNLPDGDYILRFEVNPDRKIHEVGYENNAGEIKVNIKGFKVSIVK